MNLSDFIERVLELLASVAIICNVAGAPPGSEAVRPEVGGAAPQVRWTDAGDWIKDPEVSWYGPGFYGNRTACGLKYSKTILGVAHRSLPCGTLVEFRYKGRTQIVPVIDRGPYVAGRTWDLSRALCKVLDHCWTGPIEWRLVNE